MVAFNAYAKKQVSKGKQARVILILHGGLVSIEEGTVEAYHILEAMDIEDRDFFPIFLNWEAGIPRSYFDHLLNVRRGERVGKLRGYSTAPFVGFADFGRALGSTPVFLYQQAGYAWSGQKTGGRFPERDGNRIPDGWVGNVELPSKADQPKQKFSLLTFFPGIVRLATTPLADFAGTGAYQNMLRRSRLMFLLDSDFKQMRYRPCGALGRLMHELRSYELQELKMLRGDDPSDRNRRNDLVTQLRALQVTKRSLSSTEERDLYTAKLANLSQELEKDTSILAITVVSHSLGAVIANEMIYRNSDLYFDNVVYMAAANSVKDFASLALPYLQANPTTRFHNLTLHPFREVNEVSFFDTVPEGSLLTWIDRFLVDSKSTLDGTFGSWNNLSQSLSVVQYLETDTRARLTVKVFDLTDDTPQRHGDFNDPHRHSPTGKGYQGGKFWLPEFWEIEEASEQ